ncbi:hypothetical protein [uncultured Desulfuromusa sp.]|uniref:TonB-dependent receptor plug domain-containing protein n=1 Tax=uncultured Desulfuromusa sp. TaxID=219183 RepID=UPI002AA6F4DE|nr:hypothetical protein [uncultured Desulfuromusa sp.]
MNFTPATNQWTRKLSLFLLLLLVLPQIAGADNSKATPSSSVEILPVMPAIHVEAARIAPTTGMTIIDKEMIENLPTRNGSVNEIIGIVPGVQYSEYSLNSSTGGEITPPIVSISGSRFYDNNFTIESISNNNSLDPAVSVINDATKLPGHSQIHFLSPQVIEKITVYNSNIPAKFGGFTGGQIDTEIISPTSDFWGKINYRTTDSSWTSFHIDPDDQEAFDNSNNVSMQPEFKKHEFGFTLNTPMGIDTRLVTSYQQLYSKIPLQHLGGTTSQTRKQETFLAKLDHDFSNRTNISLTALYTPTSSFYFAPYSSGKPDHKNSNYKIDSENYSFLAQVEKELHKSLFSLTFGYTNQKLARYAPDDRFAWSSATDSIDWSSTGLGYEGGLGELETGQDQLSIKSSIAFDSINWGQTSHIFEFGGEVSYANKYYKRPKTNYYYNSYRIDDSISCAPDDSACIENEQYLYKRTKYLQADTDAEMTNISAFIQNSMIWNRLEIIPGIRMSYDDFSGNLNYAPRFAASLDLFGNQWTTLFVGKNRYYSGTLLTHALYEDIIIIKQERADNSSDWIDVENRPISSRFENNEIKTPYSDELTLGVIQKFLGGNLKFQYIEKSNKDEFARSRIRETGEPDIYIFNNFGRSEHESFQLSWQRSWMSHFLEINVTWQETTTSHDSYSNTLNENDTTETIWYEGEELYYYEFPRTDFNRPVVANLIYTIKLPGNITFTNTTKYRGAYWRHWLARDDDNHLIQKPSLINPEQSDPYVYEKVKSEKSVFFDWRFSWKTPGDLDQNMLISLDILNVFNRKMKYGYDSGDYGYHYELGRQFWAGVELNF